MKKLTIGEAATKLGITKEAIYNRIRRGSIESIVENDERYIIITDNGETVSNNSANKQTQNTNIRVKKTASDDRYVNYLLLQINELKTLNNELNRDKERLTKEKEQLLVEQRIALETIYKERDEQLKTILSLANRSLLASPAERADTVTINANYEPFSAQNSNENGDFTDWREIKSYLKARGISKKKKKKIIMKVKKVIGEDDDVREDDGVLYAKKDRIEGLV